MLKPTQPHLSTKAWEFGVDASLVEENRSANVKTRQESEVGGSIFSVWKQIKKAAPLKKGRYWVMIIVV